MFWFCSGHFTATWLVCLGLIFKFQAATTSHPLTYALFALLFWPVVLELLSLKGYFSLKAATLDRLKARVRSGELKKAIVFAFGFSTSLLAAAGIGGAIWAVRSMDHWFGRLDGWISAVHTIVWFPISFLLWIVPPVIALAMLAGRGARPPGKNSGKRAEAVHA